MKSVLTTNINGSTSMSFKRGVLNHLQNAHQEITISLGKALIGENYNTSTPYALYGLVNTGSAPTYTISDGIILYNNDLYLVTGTTLTLTGLNVVTLSLSTTYVTGVDADPVYHTDGNSYNVLQDKKLAIGQGLSGTGLFNYTDIQFSPVGVSLSGALGANYTTVSTPKYRRSNEGLITLEGEVQCGASAAAGDTVLTMPTGARPAYTIRYYVNVYSPNLGGTQGFMALTLNTNGTLVLDRFYAYDGSSLSGKRISLNTLAPYYNK